MLLSPALRGPTHCRPFWASPQTFQHRAAQVNLGTGPYMGSDWSSGIQMIRRSLESRIPPTNLSHATIVMADWRRVCHAMNF